MEVVTCAVAKLNIDWPTERWGVQRSKLDEHILQSAPKPPHWGLPLFQDLHTEVWRSWRKPYSSRLSSPTVNNYSSTVGLKENGYGMITRVE